MLTEAMSAGVAFVGYSLGKVTHGAKKGSLIFSDKYFAVLAGIPQVLFECSSLLGRFSASEKMRAVSESGWNMIYEKTHGIYDRILSEISAGYGAEDV